MVVLPPLEPVDDGGVRGLGDVGDGFDDLGVENVEWTLSLFSKSIANICKYTFLVYLMLVKHKLMIPSCH